MKDSKEVKIKSIDVPITVDVSKIIKALNNPVILPFNPAIITQVAEASKQYNEAALRTSKIVAPVLESIRNSSGLIALIKSIQSQSVISAELSKNVQNSIRAISVLQTGLTINIEAFRQINNIIITLPPNGFEHIVGIDTNVLLNVEKLGKVKKTKNEFNLSTRTTSTTNLGILQFKTTQQTNLIVTSLQQDMAELKSFVYEDSKHKDEMLQELLEYYKNGGSTTVQIKEVKYNKKSSELIIDKHVIKIRADTRQQQLCNILLSSKTSAKKVWEVYDIVTLSGEYESNSEWNETFYNAVRHLNEKIQRIAHIEKFFLYDNKTILINPKYASLLK